jgi:spore maturation protein CgeB
MKLVFVGSLSNISASGRQRLWALEQNKVDVTVINKDEYNKGKWVNRFIRLFKLGSLLVNKKLERDIFECCENALPNVIWIEWPREISSVLLINLKKIDSKPSLICFQDDNPWGNRKNDFWMWNNYLKNIPYFDLHLVKRENDIENIKLLGGKRCHIWKHGVYSPLFNTSEFMPETKYPVSFVGTCMDKREVIIEFLLINNIDIHIFGNKWSDRTNLPLRFPNNFHAAVEGSQYADVIKHSQICLGMVSQSNLDEWTMRSYEVPGCSRLLIAQDTNEHRKLFEGFIEDVLFNSNAECLERVQYFLKNKIECSIISKQINKKMDDDGNSLSIRMTEFLETFQLLI